MTRLVLLFLLATVARADFQPTDISGLILWLDASRNITLTSGKVSEWGDSSNNGNKCWQATAANRPTTLTSAVTGLPAVKFATANSTYLSSTATLAYATGPRTIVMWAQPYATSNNDIIFSISLGACGVGHLWAIDDTDIWGCVTDITGLPSFGNVGGTAYQMMIAGWGTSGAGAGIQRWSNLSQISTNVANPAMGTGRGYTVGAGYPGVIWKPFNGEVGTVLAYNRYLTNNEITALYYYFSVGAEACPPTPTVTPTASPTASPTATVTPFFTATPTPVIYPIYKFVGRRIE